MKPLGYTKVPDYIIDSLMHHMSGSEFKLMIYIIRKTIGWNKERDRISHRQFRQTGLKARTISSALASLEEKKLIEITDRNGRVLCPQKRKHNHHIYYACGKSSAKIAMPIAKNASDLMQKLHITIDTNKQKKHITNSARKKSDTERLTDILNSW